nr:MAK10-like protein [Tanacetum cinerariifolium]
MRMTPVTVVMRRWWFLCSRIASLLMVVKRLVCLMVVLDLGFTRRMTSVWRDNGTQTLLETPKNLGLLEDLALYDNENWNDPRDFTKLVKAISLPQDVPSTSVCRLIELKNQVQHLMEAHLAPTQLTQVNKITSSCQICSGPHDTRYCIENPEQAFVEYASSRTDEARGLVSNFMASQDARLSTFEADFKQQQSKMTNKIDTVLKAITDRIAGALPSDTVKNPKLNVNSTTSISFAHSYRLKTHNAQPISIVRSTPLRYISSNKATPMMTSRKKIRKKKRTAGKISIPTLPRHPIHQFCSSSKSPLKGAVRFTNETDEIAYKMPNKIEQYNSLSDLEKEHTKSVYFRNEEEERSRVCDEQNIRVLQRMSTAWTRICDWSRL